ncbi:MAG TPA: hypothetical protein DCY80_07475 [Solibacterales bacterium]|nr:hypothetical protein [Bryobacterales bacterium]
MAQAPHFDRITVDPGKCGGKPCIRGMRITVRRVLELLATFPNRAELFQEYPFLEEEDLQQAAAYSSVGFFHSRHES